jgi:hypothetical protein
VCDAGCNAAPPSYRVADERQRQSKQKRSGLKAKHQTSHHGARDRFLYRPGNVIAMKWRQAFVVSLSSAA